MTENFNELSKEQLIEKVLELQKDYSDLAKENLDLGWLFGNMCRTLKDYIENPIFAKGKRLPLAYKVVEDNTEELLSMLNPIN